MFGIVIIYYLLKRVESEKFAFLYVLVLILIPSVNGYSLFDDKDIPFGLHLFIAYLSYALFIKKFEVINSQTNFCFLLVYLLG